MPTMTSGAWWTILLGPVGFLAGSLLALWWITQKYLPNREREAKAELQEARRVAREELLAARDLAAKELERREAAANASQASWIGTLNDIIERQRTDSAQARLDHMADLKEMHASNEREVEMLKQSLDNLVAQLGGRMDKIEAVLKRNGAGI